MKTVNFTDPTFAELVRYFAPGISSSLSAAAQEEIRRVFVADPVVVIPPAGGPIPTSLPGYTRVIGQEWTWGQPFATINTTGWDGKSIVIIGVTVPAVATGQRTFTLSEQDGRPGVWGTEREVCIARSPGVFDTDIVNGYVKGYNPSRVITADANDPSRRAITYLPPGGHYFINVRWSDPSNARMQI
jgi:hypothetical protein